MTTKDDEGIGMVSDPAAARRAKRAQARARKAALPAAAIAGTPAEHAVAGPSSELTVAESAPAEPIASENAGAAAPTPVEATDASTDMAVIGAEASSDASAGGLSAGSPTGDSEKAVEPTQPKDVGPAASAAEPVEREAVTPPPVAAPLGDDAEPAVPAKAPPAVAAAPIVLPDSRPGEAPRGRPEPSAAPRVDVPRARVPVLGNAETEAAGRRSGSGVLMVTVTALAIVLGAGWYAYANGWIYTAGEETEVASADSAAPATEDVRAEAEPATEPVVDTAANETPPPAPPAVDDRAELEASLRETRERLREAEARLAEFEREQRAAPSSNAAAESAPPPAQPRNAAATPAPQADTRDQPIRDVTPINRPDDNAASAAADQTTTGTTGDVQAGIDDAAPPQEDADTLAALPEAAPLTPPALPVPRPATLASAERNPVPSAIVSGRQTPPPEIAARSRPGGDPVLRGWFLRDVYGGMALIDGPSGLIEVMPGDSLPGTGRIQSIRRVGGGWAVVTSRGIIPYQP